MQETMFKWDWNFLWIIWIWCSNNNLINVVRTNTCSCSTLFSMNADKIENTMHLHCELGVIAYLHVSGKLVRQKIFTFYLTYKLCQAEQFLCSLQTSLSFLPESSLVWKFSCERPGFAVRKFCLNCFPKNKNSVSCGGINVCRMYARI